MNTVIFAGGAGTRLWPLSRRNSPKQFEVLKDDQSTLQMAIERISDFGVGNIFIATNEKYVDLVQEQIPELPANHILAEPAKRDLAAAVGLALFRLKKQGIKGTISILWADHFMTKPENFVKALKDAEKLIEEDPKRFIFIGEKPRFANHNLGWIRSGNKISENLHKFVEWKYRPELEDCKEMLESGDWVWNPGYFVFDIDFVLELYKEHMPEMYQSLDKMTDDEFLVQTEYQKLESISFDNAIIEKVNPDQATVMKVDLGWSDPGTLYALKESLTNSEEENYTKGNVMDVNSKDCFVYNEEDKLVSTVGLEGLVVVNTKDSLLVCHKDSVPDIKKLLKKLDEDGKEKYL